MEKCVLEKELKPTCPYCHAEWTDDMIKVEDISSSEGCDSCGWGAEVTGSVNIHCSSCKRLIYQKDFVNRPHG